MREIFSGISKKDTQLILKIAERATVTVMDRQSVAMTVTAVHNKGCRLNLEQLLAEDEETFWHDLHGMAINVDKTTGHLTGHFVPRCTRGSMHRQHSEITEAGSRINIYTDPDPMNPRKEFDNVSQMVFFHKRLSIGDDHGILATDYTSYDDVREYLMSMTDDPIVRIEAVYAYDHGSFTLKIGSFYGLLLQGHAEFDSGQVGFILVRESQLALSYADGERPSYDELLAIFEAEIKTYNAYLNGETCMYTVDLDDESASCTGFYDYDHCLLEAQEEAKVMEQLHAKKA